MNSAEDVAYATLRYGSVQDSRNRTQYIPDGGLRDRPPGKGRYDLISPIAMARLAEHYENGAAKYDDRNWENGIPVSTCIDSALRHLFQFLGGDRSEDHLAAVMWNAAAAIHIEDAVNSGELPVALLDLPRYSAAQCQDGAAGG